MLVTSHNLFCLVTLLTLLPEHAPPETRFARCVVNYIWQKMSVIFGVH